jgi:hypothetical protein
MSCAGYLLLNNYKVVYVTLENGILTCTDIPRRPEEEGEEREEEKEERNIPIEEDNKKYE